jgi:hypothetical protein
MDPRWRLQRKYPGEGLLDLSPAVTRVADRDRPLKAERATLGSKVTIPAATTRRNGVVVEPRPNAPLLKRLVRYPFALHGTQPRRHTLMEAVPWGAHGAQPREPVSASFDDLRGGPAVGNPLRAVPTRPPRLGARPTVAEWLDSRGSRGRE